MAADPRDTKLLQVEVVPYGAERRTSYRAATVAPGAPRHRNRDRNAQSPFPSHFVGADAPPNGHRTDTPVEFVRDRNTAILELGLQSMEMLQTSAAERLYPLEQARSQAERLYPPVQAKKSYDWPPW